MKEYDYVIYGAGPTGLTLAYLLAKNNFKIALIEKEDKIGGCWKVEWKNNKYFTEHAPRVLVDDKTGFYNLLKQIGFNYEKETVPTYGNIFQTNLKLINFFIKRFTFGDYIKILFSSKKDLTVMEWLEKNKLSYSAVDAFSVFSILLANSPKKLLISELFNERGFPSMFLQFKNNNKWLNLLKNKLEELNVDIILNHSLINLEYDNINNKISFGVLDNNLLWKGKSIRYIYGKQHLITFPPKAMYNFLIKQNNLIRNNWEELRDEKLDRWLDDSTYFSIGFQLHFKESKEDNPNLDLSKKPWCWSCVNEYNLIILPTSDYQEIYSYDKNIKTVWSCTIVDTSIFINRLNKTINQMTKEEIIDDILKIINREVNVTPDYITFYDGLDKDYINGIKRWISKDSSFSVGKSGIIKSKGTLDNLYWIGPHNSKGITTINKSVNIAISWIKNKNFNIYNLEEHRDNSWLIYVIIVLLLIFLYRKYN